LDYTGLPVQIVMNPTVREQRLGAHLHLAAFQVEPKGGYPLLFPEAEDPNCRTGKRLQNLAFCPQAVFWDIP